MKLKFLFYTLNILFTFNSFAQWTLPNSKDVYDISEDIFSSSSKEGAMILNYNPFFMFNKTHFGIQLCVDLLNEKYDENGNIYYLDSSKFNYLGPLSYEIKLIDKNNISKTYSYDELKDTIILIQDEDYFSGGWRGQIFNGKLLTFNIDNKEYKRISYFGEKKCNCNYYIEYELEKYFLNSDFFNKILNSNSVSFKFKDEFGHVKILDLSMLNLQKLLKTLHHYSYFDNDYWFWNDDYCLTKWRTTIHNKSGNIILKNQTVTFELLEYNQTIFKKSFPISQNIGIDEVIPIDLMFDTPLCLDNIEELKKHYTWKINFN